MVPLLTNTTPAASNPGEPLQLREVRPPVPIHNPWLWSGVALACLLIALAAYRLWRRLRRTHPSATAAPISIPPHVAARNALRQALELINQPNPFCTRVSAILRTYLEQRFAFHAPDRTTEEFLDELHASPRLELQQKQNLGDFLARCDLVKFARHHPPEPELRQLWDVAAQLVENTTPAPDAPTQPLNPNTPPPTSRPPTPNTDLRTPPSA